MADDPCVYPQAASQLDSLGMEVIRPTPSPKGFKPCMCIYLITLK